jgi:hypothetical protein
MKYIVYLTKNLINNKIYIGVHQTDNPNKFDGYIGCGVYTTQSSSYNHPKTRFQYAVKKYGPKNFKRTILKIYDNEEDAYYMEALLVNEKFIARKDVYNQVLGGHGGDIANNAIPCYQYDLEGNFINEYPSKASAAKSVNRCVHVISIAIKDKVKAANYFWSITKVNKLDISNYKLTTNRIPVFQYSKTGEYDCCYDSISDAARVNNSSSSNIIRSIKLGYLTNNKYFSLYYEVQFSIAKTESIKHRKVYQYALNGDFIAEYNSEADANRALNKNIKIGQAIKLKHTAGGYQWSLEKLDKMSDVSKKTSGKARKVGQYTIEGKLIKIYNTVTACVQDFVGCRHVLSGRNKTSGGYVFKYID